MRLRIPCGVILLMVLVSARARAQQTETKKTRGLDDPNVAAGVRYLQLKAPDLQVGEAALAALSMHLADLPTDDPAMQICLQKVFSRFGPERYVPERTGGYQNYEEAVVCMALTAIDPDVYKPQIEIVANDLVSYQKGYGAWDYAGDRGGDSSMTQYCILALWEAESIGVDIPPTVWDNCAEFFINNQAGDGGWAYHPKEGGKDGTPTTSMTCAGTGSLMICADMLTKFRKATTAFNPLLTPLIYEGTVLEKYARYKVKTNETALNRAVDRGVAWLRQVSTGR